MVHCCYCDLMTYAMLPPAMVSLAWAPSQLQNVLCTNPSSGGGNKRQITFLFFSFFFGIHNNWYLLVLPPFVKGGLGWIELLLLPPAFGLFHFHDIYHSLMYYFFIYTHRRTHTHIYLLGEINLSKTFSDILWNEQGIHKNRQYLKQALPCQKVRL